MHHFMLELPLYPFCCLCVTGTLILSPIPIYDIFHFALLRLFIIPSLILDLLSSLTWLGAILVLDERYHYKHPIQDLLL
jgi:hypothetical protein